MQKYREEKPEANACLYLSNKYSEAMCAEAEARYAM